MDELEGAPRRTGRFWFDFLAAGAAIFISVVSVVIGMRGEATQRELLAASSWPFMQVDVDSSEVSENVIKVVNEGVGPAKIVSFEVFYDKTAVASAMDLLRRCCNLPANSKDAYGKMNHGIRLGDVANNVIRPDQSLVMISLSLPAADPEIYHKFGASLSRISYRLCYCSIQDKCWVSNLRGLNPAEVAACPVPQHPYKTFAD